MKLRYGHILFCALASGAIAADLPVALVLPAQPVAAGSATYVDVVIVNPEAAPTDFLTPAQVDARLVNEHEEWKVVLSADSSRTHSIAPNAFVRQRFSFTLPKEAAGRLQLELPAPLTALGALVVEDSGEGNELPMPASDSGDDVVPITPALADIERAFIRHFAFHEPIYFLYGPDAPAAKFQFSFKYRLFGKGGMLGEAMAPLHGLYFGYTQRSLWDLGGESSPFYDTSYMPEMIFESLAPDHDETHGGLRWLGLQAAFRHESNGRDGFDSRSLNIAYLRTGVSIGRLDGWRLLVLPRVFTYTSKSEDNDDIERYRGYGDLTLLFGRNGGPQLSVTGQMGDEWDKGSIQVDLTHPIHIPFGDFNTYLQVQYFSGYGESLRSYDQKSTAWRAGFAFVR